MAEMDAVEACRSRRRAAGASSSAGSRTTLTPAPTLHQPGERFVGRACSRSGSASSTENGPISVRRSVAAVAAERVGDRADVGARADAEVELRPPCPYTR